MLLNLETGELCIKGLRKKTGGQTLMCWSFVKEIHVLLSNYKYYTSKVLDEFASLFINDDDAVIYLNFHTHKIINLLTNIFC